MGNHDVQGVETYSLNVKSFNIVRAFTDTDFFSKTELSPTARLIMFSLANMYNPSKGYVYPKNKKLEFCTGAKERAVVSALNELKKEGYIVIVYTDSLRKIYFSKKTYELLGLETGAKNADGGAEIAQSPAKIAPPCHEHVKTYNKNNFVNKNNNFRLKEKIGKLLEGENYLTNKVIAETILSTYHPYNIKSDNDISVILQINNVWKFKREKFTVLDYLENRKSSDQIFSKKIEKISLEVKTVLEEFKTEICQINHDWKNYKPELSYC